MSLKVLGSSNDAVGIVVVSVAWVFLVDLKVAHFCMVGADSPWKDLRRSCYGLMNKKWRCESKNCLPKGPHICPGFG